MCVPQTLAALQTLQTVSGVVQNKEDTESELSQIQEQEDEARRQAERERREGQIRVNREKRNIQQDMGAQRARLANSGAEIGSGTGKQKQDDIALFGDEAVRDIKRGTDERVSSYNQRADQNRRRLNDTQKRASRQSSESLFNTGSTILTRSPWEKRRGLIRL